MLVVDTLSKLDLTLVIGSTDKLLMRLVLEVLDVAVTESEEGLADRLPEEPGIMPVLKLLAMLMERAPKPLVGTEEESVETGVTAVLEEVVEFEAEPSLESVS